MPHLFVSNATDTMKLSTAAIKTFMEEHKDIYPYNDVPTTRQGYHPRWLLCMSKNKRVKCGDSWDIMSSELVV